MKAAGWWDRRQGVGEFLPIAASQTELSGGGSAQGSLTNHLEKLRYFDFVLKTIQPKEA
jgi:hypothetical protein